MEVSPTADGRVRLVLPMSSLLFIQWALWTTVVALERYEGWFRDLTGLSLIEVRSLNDETTAIRYALEGRQRRVDPDTGEFEPPLEPRKTDTAWDALPKIEAEELPDGRVAVILPQEKLAALPELIEASLVYVAPRGTESEESAFRLRFATSTEEAGTLRNELRRMVREMRGAPSGGRESP